MVPSYGVQNVTVHKVFITKDDTVGDNRRPDMKEASKTICSVPYRPFGLCGWSESYHRQPD
jgi:hypothetical protein